METPAPDAASYIRAAGNLNPQVQRLRTEIERDRTLPASLVASMADAGLFGLWLARAFGGPELSFTEFACVIEELSRADGSVGWCANIAAGLSRLSGYLPEQVCREIFADGSGRLAGSFSPTGKAVAVPGGFRVSGRWSYGSFIQHSHWTIGNSIVHDGETPRRGDNGVPDIRFMIFPTSAVEVIDNWYVSGLRGTGSHDFQVHDIFVPEEFTLSGTTAKPRQPGTLYAAPMITIFAATNACVSIGIARAAIDAFVALSEDKLPTGSAVKLRDKSVVQVDLARAEAMLRSGRAFLFEAVEEVWNEAAKGGTPTARQRVIARIASAKAAEVSAQAVDLLFNAAGGTALFESNPIERCFRDVHATTQHTGTRAANYELAGRVLLGLEPATPWF